MIVLSAQLSNPIPAAAQDFSNDYRSGNAMSHFRHMPPELGTPLQDCIHPTEPDLTGHRYRVAQDSNQLLIWPDAARDANVRNLWIGTFSIASATTDPTTRPGGTVTP
ncbi:hypothetical protein CAK95_15445 [Pseudorhodoplanes sinuspersici]|uniref:Uncharacterized protein n=1 Tax=Pseudorhodoplanes sinuspersici TaxID=1235591 RepID=A0A1W6ZSG8_9HYPH|nr:hypothetical protein CAK95_15445 [Pseudorhodoplanes sinuspersici]